MHITMAHMRKQARKSGIPVRQYTRRFTPNEGDTLSDKVLYLLLGERNGEVLNKQKDAKVRRRFIFLATKKVKRNRHGRRAAHGGGKQR